MSTIIRKRQQIVRDRMRETEPVVDYFSTMDKDTVSYWVDTAGLGFNVPAP